MSERSTGVERTGAFPARRAGRRLRPRSWPVATSSAPRRGSSGLLRSGETLTRATQRLVVGDQALAQEFTEADVTGPFRSNGTSHPRSAAYDALAANGFADWRLQVDGLVAQPAQFSLDELKAMPSRTQITRHDCVEGWSAIGKWTGVPLHEVLARVQPEPSARYVVFHCADPMQPNGTQPYYESIDMVDAHHPQTILAYELNGAALPIAQRRADSRAHRAPARLQDGEIHHAHRTGRQLRGHSRRQRRLLGRPRLRVVRRNLDTEGRC